MLRRLALAALVLVLAACGDQTSREPFADSRLPASVAPRFYPPEGWAWGFLQVGDAPAQRYGVSTPPVAPKATVLILSGYGDLAENWFETVRDLNSRGYAVWLLERAGQGGSGRLIAPRDLGHVVSFDPDVAAVRAMIRTVVRPHGEIPLVIVGHSLGGLIALRSVEDGAPVDGLVLSAPAIEIARLPFGRDKVAAISRTARALGLGGLRAPGEHGWRREVSQGPVHDALREGMTRAWPTTNPDLRMGGPSLAWLAAFYDMTDSAQRRLNSVAVPALLINAGADRRIDTAASQRACRAIKTCRSIMLAGAWHDLPREADPTRNAFLAAIDDFVQQRIAGDRR